MSEPLDLWLRGATVVAGDYAGRLGVGVRAGRIAELLPESAPAPTARTVLDLGGATVLPGLIDPHVHCREPGAHAHKATWASESRAAAAGGVTTLLAMPNTSPFCGTRAVLSQVRQAARASRVDYACHFGVAPDALEELTAVRNVPSFKLYLNETTGITSPLCDESLLQRVLALGHPLVAHAEGPTLDWLLALHARWGLGPLYLAHVALAGEVDSLRRAKAAGQWVYAEATPHHLFMTDADATRLGPLADMRPTLKSAADQAALWAGVADGTIDTIGSDHAPHLLPEKQSPQPPPGITGLQTMLPLLLNAVADGRLAWRELVRLTSQRAAAIFALRDKGELRVGADADLVVVDPGASWTIRNESQLSQPGWTPFDGWSGRGAAVLTLRRGEVIYRDGVVLGESGGREVTTRDPGAA